ncbi:uncharacterized protein LOC108872657 [Lates japonicus]|uniref:Mixed lineage kinase domain-containing protein n=1 Tax=Lates japonicus TaxID=270547 RepID=A0AAD3MWD9_LATJO|nr:uncharacterized protein AKAME5_001347800 [Lates japonicus]
MEHIGEILGLCRGIFWMATEAKACKKRCRHLAERVKAMEELVERLKQRGPGGITPNVNRALWQLSRTLTAGHEVVKKCAKTKLVNVVKCKSEFNSVNEGLRDTYHILAGALQISQGSTMRTMFQDFGLDDDDDDWDDGLGLFGALAPSSRTTVPARYSPAAASPYSAIVTPSPYFAAAAPRPQPTTAVYAATVGVEGDTMYYAEGFFLM